MNINQELVEKINILDFLYFLHKGESVGIKKDMTLNDCIEIYEKEISSRPAKKIIDMKLIPTKQMIPVEELERLVINRDLWMGSFDDHKKGMNALFDKLQEKINKYK